MLVGKMRLVILTPHRQLLTGESKPFFQWALQLPATLRDIEISTGLRELVAKVPSNYIEAGD